MPLSIKLAAIVAGVWLALCGSAVVAQSDDWRDRRIDGSTEASFESSIAALQNSLPPRRREDFDIALAVLWMTESLGPAGLDLKRDGAVDRADTRRLVDGTIDLLTDIQRGDLLSSIDKRATNNGGGYTAASYLEQLNGLTSEEVLDLAGRPAKLSAGALRRADARRRQRLNPGVIDHGLNRFIDLIHGGVPPKPTQ